MSQAPIPPQNLEAEENVLGAMMLSPRAIDAVSDVLDPADFYRESHGVIYRAALDLYAKSEPVDAITLVGALEQHGRLESVGGRKRLRELAAVVPASANAAHYARLVHEAAMLRELIKAGHDIGRLGWERPGELDELVDKAESIIFDLSQQRHGHELEHVSPLLKDGFDRLTRLYEAGDEITGIPSGFRELDRLTAGFQAGNLVIVAARPSMGKSALAICTAANMAIRQQKAVAIFSLEMSKGEVIQRLMCSEARVDSRGVRTGKLDSAEWGRLTRACDAISKAPLYVDDSGAITVAEIRSKARRLRLREPSLGLVVVDYLQLMGSGKVEHRVQEVAQISRALKVLARDLDVPVMALSQLSRNVESRADRRPILADLRDSGAIEQDADLVVFVYRDEVYHPDTNDSGIAELHLAKHRNGPTGTARLSWRGRYTLFQDAGPGD